jgi:hypothetical protein
MKLSLDSIARIYQHSKEQILKNTFKNLQQYAKTQKILEKINKNIQKYYFRHTFKLLTKIKQKSDQKFKTEAKIFD